jgi:hypothetical protein
VSWYNSIICLGKGNVVGNLTILAYEDLAPIAINYVSVTGLKEAGNFVISGGGVIYAPSLLSLALAYTIHENI